MPPIDDEKLKEITIGERVPHNAPITLSEYDPNWPIMFQQETTKINSALGAKVLLLEHVGSTSVPGLIAKPKIDILLVVEDSADEPSYVPLLEKQGYILRIRESDWFEHRLFKSPDIDINLHVFSSGCPEITRMLSFRDHLRSNEQDREIYAKAKRELAKKTWKYIQNYADAKSDVVEQILKRSLD